MPEQEGLSVKTVANQKRRQLNKNLNRDYAQKETIKGKR